MRRPGANDCCRCGARDNNATKAACDYIRDHMAGQEYVGLVCAKCNAGDPTVCVTWNICRECGFQFGDYENQSPPQDGYPLCFWCEEAAAQLS